MFEIYINDPRGLAESVAWNLGSETDLKELSIIEHFISIMWHAVLI